MKAAVVNVLGQPPRYQDFAEPKAGDGEVLINVRAAGLHPIVKATASGSHYAFKGEVPVVPGIDGVGTLEDGSRVFFTFARKPWGTMCERTLAPRARCLPLPDNIDDVQAAAIVNPGMSAWLSIRDRAGLVKGESVLILGATGVAGQLAIQAARNLGARRIVAAGRNLGALASENLDGLVSLTQDDDSIREAFVVEARKGIDVVIDYLWGRPTELLLEALGHHASRRHAAQHQSEADGQRTWLCAAGPRARRHSDVLCDGRGGFPQGCSGAGSAGRGGSGLESQTEWKANCIHDLSTPESDTYTRNTSVTGNTLGGCRCLRE
jgi:NADPH:quinone reductase-like Zn-dependent oxidoreductase